MLAYVILALVGLQRVGELILASRNTRALKRQGGIEYGRRHYPLMVLLHASWLTAIAIGISGRAIWSSAERYMTTTPRM